MAQLSEDSFAFGGALRRLDDALNDLQKTLPCVAEAETVSLADAQNRILVRDCLSAINIPSFDNSAVDGYAVRFADLTPHGQTILPVFARIPAGQRSVSPLTFGTAARIFTGAPMPDGADTVFMQEDVVREGDFVCLPPGLRSGSNRRFAGEDFAIGDVIAQAGTRLKPQHLAGLAATGIRQVDVRKRLRVAMFSTGNEIVDLLRHPADASLPAGCQFDSNRPMLAAVLAARGMDVIDLGVLPDDQDAIRRAVDHAAGLADAIITSGGVSTGEEDHVKAAIEAAGKLDFWRLAIKPGRPIAMGTVNGRSFLGMPGNPAAVFVTFTRFVGPVLDMLAGATPLRPVGFPVISGFDYRKKADRREYVRVSLDCNSDGMLVATRFQKDGAALVSSLIAADALADLPEDITEIRQGERLVAIPLSSLMG